LEYATSGGLNGDPLIGFTPTTTGTYYLSAEASSLFSSGVGTYTIGASLSGTTDDYTANAATTGAVEIGGTATGTLEVKNDEDWFAVSLQAGTTYLFNLSGANSGGGTLPSPTLYLYGWNGSFTTILEYATSGGLNGDPLIGFTPTTTGTYYLSAEASSLFSSGVGTYTVSVQEILPPTLLGFTTSNLSKLEGHAGTTPFTFTVTRGGDTSRTVSADWIVTGGSSVGGTVPANGADFVGGLLPSGRVSLAAGETSKAITVLLAVDTAAELNESFTVILSGAQAGVAIGTASATGVILNDDAPPSGTLSIARLSAQKSEGQSGTTPFTFTVTRGGDTSGTASADWTLTPGGAAGTSPIDPADLATPTLPSGRIGFAAGETSKTITVLVAGDTTIEPTESFTITLSGAQAGVTLDTASATGIVQNDDIPGTGTLSIARLLATRSEGQAGSTDFTFLVTRSGSTAGPASAAWAVTGGTLAGTVATTANDFAGSTLPSGVVSFAPGETSRVITIQVAGDTASEFNESFTVTLSGPPAGVTIGTASAVGIVYNDDAPGTGTLSIARLSAQKAEGHAGTTPFTFTVTRSGDPSGTASADWIVTAGSSVGGTVPANGADFVGGLLPSGRVSFAAGETSKTVTVNVAGDGTIELNDSFTVTLSGAQAGVAIGTAVASGVILNDDFPPSGTLSIARLAATRSEGQAGATDFTFLVTRGGSTTGPASASWAVTGGTFAGTVAAAANDFAGSTLPTGTVSFAPGETTQVITIQVAGDTAIELNESFTVTLSAPPAGVTIGTAAATAIVYNDDTPGTGTLSIARLAATRGEGAIGATPFTFTVTRSGDTSGTASADWIVTGGGASGTVSSNGADFVGGILPSGRVGFAAGETSKTITVAIAGDTAAELNESFAVTLSGAQAGVAIGTASAVGIVYNDDFVSTAASQALSGTTNADVFLLGGGLDTVTGRAGLDLFLFQPAAIGDAAASATTMEDFSRPLGETLDLSAIDAIAATPGNDAFTFIGTAPFSGTPGELRWQDLGTSRLIQGNVTADTTADLTIFVKATGPVDASWFVL